mgnify:CR=1 FL=1
MIDLEPDGTINDDNQYPKVFFLMHKWIMESEYLSNMLFDFYKHSGDDCKKATNNTEKRYCTDYQLRICRAYKYVEFEMM